MKNLANTSPFLLLLVPVFMALVFTLTLHANQKTDEVVVKPAKTTVSAVKQALVVFN
ncbi:hypothetical protein [Pedobacter sp. MW01-1-1]|uniref:hypothetical protein n=1 Tax=Pedobacter sp. MW01-1-1 TaxID=3383027 RepID=UPI003FF01F66